MLEILIWAVQNPFSALLLVQVKIEFFNFFQSFHMNDIVMLNSMVYF